MTFPRLLQENGYETAFVGKWHMGIDDTPRPGFDHWVGFPGQGTYFDPEFNVDSHHEKRTGYTTDILAQFAMEALSQRRSQPFCLWMAHKAVTQRQSNSPMAASAIPMGASLSRPSGTKRFLPACRCCAGPTPVNHPTISRSIEENRRPASARPRDRYR